MSTTSRGRTARAFRFLPASALLIVALSLAPAVQRDAWAQTETPTPDPTATVTATVTFEPTPTATPTPTPTATIDHFGCYEIHRPPPNVPPVKLVDQFGESTVTIKRAKRLCPPADKENENPGAANNPAHLTSYTIKQTVPRFVPVLNVPVTNQFGTIVVAVVKPDRLLVPTAKSLIGTPAALANPIDHFKCYRVRGPRFRREDVAITTQFGQITVDIKRPLHLCTPVNKNDEDPTAPRHVNQLMCYQIRGPRPQVPDEVFTKNQFSEDRYQVFGARELCVPSLPPCASAGITIPATLPDGSVCTALPRPPVDPNCENTAGEDCGNGWKTLGCRYSGPDELDSGSSGTAQAYVWSSGSTKCFYLYRVTGRVCSLDPATDCDPTAIPDPCVGPGKGTCIAKTLNGVHCYDTTDCDVCAFDYPPIPAGFPPPPALVANPTWDQLLPASSLKGTIDNCSVCHAPGPITPKLEFFSGLNDETYPINQECSKRGGPVWIAAPRSWLQRGMPLMRVPPPAGGGCATGGSCHVNGFVKGSPLFCGIAKATFIAKNGAMPGINRVFDDFQVCKDFTTKAMGCKLSDDPFACRCLNGAKDIGESDVDCGGSTCRERCGPGKACVVNADCAGGDCTGAICQPTCSDEVKNNVETDVDCGGGACDPCTSGKACVVNADCASNTCVAQVCT